MNTHSSVCETFIYPEHVAYDLQKLRSYYHSLLGQQRTFDSLAAKGMGVVYAPEFNMLAAEVARMSAALPEYTPPFGVQSFRAYASEFQTECYSLTAILSWLSAALGRLQAAIESVEPPPAAKSTAKVRILSLVNRLRKAVLKKPELEKDIQDVFGTLLVGGNVAYSRETDSIEYSSKTYIPDFTMPDVELAVEIKLCNREGREKEIIAEINDDVLAYQTKYNNLLFVVYDLGFIRDTDRFARSFEEHENVLTTWPQATR